MRIVGLSWVFFLSRRRIIVWSSVLLALQILVLAFLVAGLVLRKGRKLELPA